MISPKPPKQTRADEISARKLVTVRDGGVCVKCLRTHPMFGVNFDHRKNRSQGGLWSASNGQTLCGTGTTGCHGHVTQNPGEAIREGWAVPSYADPLVWPARRWQTSTHGMVRLSWCLYDNQGGIHWITDEEARRRMEGLVA